MLETPLEKLEREARVHNDIDAQRQLKWHLKEAEKAEKVRKMERAFNAMADPYQMSLETSFILLHAGGR